MSGQALDLLSIVAEALARILDGEFGHEAALAMTRVVLDLVHARGEVKTLEPGGVTYTEWCVYWGGDDPNTCEHRRQVDGEIEAANRQAGAATMADWVRDAHGGGIASRHVTVPRTPWQVVNTEGGE